MTHTQDLLNKILPPYAVWARVDGIAYEKINGEWHEQRLTPRPSNE